MAMNMSKKSRVKVTINIHKGMPKKEVCFESLCLRDDDMFVRER